ncbi:hypothetical protein BGZ72_004442 [Mortierella alpina]|nr:hypothetical protein BGZ72_004442 [Mortierella alpina]
MATKPPPTLPPELLTLVAENLTRKDTVQCLQVCAAWYSAMIFKIWRYVALWETSTELPFLRNPTMDALQQHQHLIRDLTVPESFANEYCSRQQPFQFKPLESLGLASWSPAVLPVHYSLTRELEVLPSLTSLSLNDVQPTLVSWVLRSIDAFPNLGEVVIRNTTIGRESALDLWRVIPRLEKLELERVTFTDMTTVQETMATMTCPRLRELLMDLEDTELDPHDQLNLVLACPALVELLWCSFSEHYYQFTKAFILFNRALDEGRFPELSIFRNRGDTLDTQIAKVLQAMKRVIEFQSHTNDFGLESFDALRPHFSTLTSLDIQHCEDMTSPMVQTVLCSCPVLQTLLVDWMWATDAIHSDKEEEGKKKWLCCSTLTSLSLSFRFREGETSLQPKVYESLARLTRLEGFMMAKQYRELHGEQGLLLLLEHGLGKLTTWKHLRYINFYHDPDQVLGEAEIAWVVEHWRELGMVFGNTDGTILDTRLRADVQRRQIAFGFPGRWPL